MKTQIRAMWTSLFFVLTLLPNLSVSGNAKVREPLWNYFQPAWISSSHAVETSDLAHLATDPENKIEEALEIPAELRTRVLFWASIFTRYDKHMKVIHDRNNPGLVYGYLDF